MLTCITIFAILIVGLYSINLLEHGKPACSSRKVKRPYCPFKNFCVFLNGEAPKTILAEREYLRERVDTLEFGMDFTNHQMKQLQARVKELEDDKANLESELSEALQAPFKKYKKKEAPENYTLAFRSRLKLIYGTARRLVKLES